MQGQIGLFGKAAEKKAPLAFQEIRPLAAHRPRPRAARRAGALRPFHNARHTHVKESGHRPTSFAARNHGHNAFTQIERIRSRHPCWPPASSTEFESDHRRFGNPQRFSQNQKDSRQSSEYRAFPAFGSRKFERKLRPPKGARGKRCQTGYRGAKSNDRKI